MRRTIITLCISIMAITSYSQWTILNTGTSKDLFSIYFTDSLNGYSVGVAATILKTIDGGITWDEISNVPGNVLRSVMFPNAQTGFAVGLNGSVVKTSDYGLTWTDLSPGQIQFYSTYFLDTLSGIAVGGDLLDGTIIMTTDGGITWNLIQNPATGRLTSIYFTNDSVGCIVGDYGRIMRSINKGLQWSNITFTGTTFCLESVCFTDVNNGYAAGDFGAIVKTNDGGLTWTPLSSGVNSNFYSIYFTDQNTGYVAGQTGIYKTTNGGEDWNLQESGASFIPRSIFFTDDQTGYIAGTAGIIIKTTNGGGVGIAQDKKNLKNVEIFPNPTKDVLYLNTKSIVGKASISLTNIEGQKLKEQCISNNITLLDVKDLPRGIYFLIFKTGEFIQRSKILKE